MKIKSIYPNIIANFKEQTFQFVNGLCDVPDAVAVELLKSKEIYSIAQQDSGSAYPKFNGNAWKKDRRLIWDGPMSFANGYGKSSMEMMKALNKKVTLETVCSSWHGNSEEYITDDLKAITERHAQSLDTYYIKYWPACFITPRVAERYIGYTMFEATRIPDGNGKGYISWIETLNNCERVLVPCTHNKQFLIESGVTKDIEVIPLGIDPKMYDQVKPIEDDNFVFGTMGTLTYRKGTDVLVEAFEKAFPKNKYQNVQLFIKTQPTGGIVNGWYLGNHVEDQRINLNISIFSPEQMKKEFFEKINCFVFPTRGEGFGLPPMEAMASGLPIICTNWSGTGDFINEDIAYPLDYKIVDTPQGDWRGYPEDLRAKGQQWAEPNLDQLIELMRHVYDNRKEAYSKGKKARKFVLDNYTWDKTAEKIIDYLDRKF